MTYSMDSVKGNAVINAFIESKKLTLNKSKCHRIHVSKNQHETSSNCPELKVHSDKMDNSDKEKYLGDVVDKSGKIRATIEDRKSKGHALVAEINAILEEIPLGQHKMEIGLHLRQAMLLNGMLYNSEVWHSITEQEIRLLETVDEHLLRSMVKGHSKTPLEFLYLETGALPIRFIIGCRRIMYLQTILKRPMSELTRKVYEAQKTHTVKGDFIELVQSDIDLIGGGGSITEEYIICRSKNALKEEIKEKMAKAAFEYLENKKKQHSKVKNIIYTKLQTEPYITSPIFKNTEVNLLHALRSRMVNVKANFPSKYQNDLNCPLCETNVDDQSHILDCTELTNRLNTSEISLRKNVYEDIFSDVQKQKEVTALYERLLEIRKSLVDENLVKSTSPSTSAEVLECDDSLLDCIFHDTFGK